MYGYFATEINRMISTRVGFQRLPYVSDLIALRYSANSVAYRLLMAK